MRWALVTLRGIGQVMFQGHALSGLLFTFGVLAGGSEALWMAVAGLAGSLIGAAVARFGKFDRAEWADGVYGFNPALVGMATFFFFRPTPAAWGLFAGFAVASTGLTWACRRFVPVPTYTLPFIVCTWALHAVGAHLALPPMQWAAPLSQGLHLSEALVEGLSEVMLVGGNPYSGAVFLAALLVSNWRHAALALSGTAVGAVMAVYHGDADDSIALGLYGYNAALTAIALSLWRPSLIAPLLGAVASVVLTEFFPRTGLPTLTAPFVLAAWAVQLIGRAERTFYPTPPRPEAPCT